jgi:predicted nucleotidyltransferase component of viral defense system
MKNIGKSIRAKLYNIAKNEKINFQHIIIRYLHERLLFRISLSSFNENFYLKGGTLLYAINTKDVQRYTLDIDFSLNRLSYDSLSVTTAIKEICRLENNDGVSFDHQNITITEIKENDVYGGLRIFIPAKLDTIRQNLQVDVGYGDKIFPKPVKINFPVLLDMLDTPVIFAYTPETLIAEKFQAMIELATLNSRMKDFYDVYILLTEQAIDKNILQKAIANTFKLRKTTLTEDHSIFTDDFKNDPQRLIMWKAFLRKINVTEELKFSIVIELIIEKLKHLAII